MKNQASLGLFTAFASFMLISPVVFAQNKPADPPKPTMAVQLKPSLAKAETGVPELVIAGHVVLRLRSHAGGLSARERAFSLRQRLGPILTLPDLNAKDVTIQQQRPGQTAYIYVRDRLLITVDRNIAQANETSIESLASKWAGNLRVALPQVNVSIRMSTDIPLVGKKAIHPPSDRPDS